MLSGLLMVLAAYLVGSISTGYILVYFTRGIDIRATGSGSSGARNVGRVLGRWGFYLTLLGDILKGMLVVFVAELFDHPPLLIGAAAVAVIVGHIWPLWLRFRGGKGIATSLGVFAALDYTLLVLGGGVMLLVYLLSRNFLVSWGTAFLLLPLLTCILGYPVHISVSLVFAVAAVLYAHKTNISAAFTSSV
ncbi:MAG: glycerol-3-phosphate acyltransferase [Candidatus Electrothrix aestuarii]|uniref:Glycerol-3-phosphate acyltransferase n=1 Tax=Candidatus Electrothrix aestuarii TaxID=3062594 RepID=A0AAU8LV56_9BACT|nr:glycerol-3-phosphate acyltransferase [Candidatus Electrothrix aestuarii]WPD24983.1 MAG: glycerol-3-phosphate acyltransferase [Candidatus Electrothrix sp. GW3-3]